jgi:hypothetical protein
VLPVLLAALDRHQAWRLPLAQRQALLALSPATADRLLRPLRQARGRQPVRPGRRPAPLAARVPIRTWGEWADVAPGADRRTSVPSPSLDALATDPATAATLSVATDLVQQLSLLRLPYPLIAFAHDREVLGSAVLGHSASFPVR